MVQVGVELVLNSQCFRLYPYILTAEATFSGHLPFHMTTPSSNDSCFVVGTRTIRRDIFLSSFFPQTGVLILFDFFDVAIRSGLVLVSTHVFFWGGG